MVAVAVENDDRKASDAVDAEVTLVKSHLVAGRRERLRKLLHFLVGEIGGPPCALNRFRHQRGLLDHLHAREAIP